MKEVFLLILFILWVVGLVAIAVQLWFASSWGLLEYFVSWIVVSGLIQTTAD